MHITLSKNSNLIPIVIVISIVVVAIVVALLLLVYRPLKYKKMANNVDSQYQFCHALLIGQNSQNVKRLEIISRTNLLYVDTYTKFSRKLKEIRDFNDFETSKDVNAMKDFLDDKDFKAFKEAHAKALTSVKNYKTAIDEFTNELHEIIKPEEESRQAALECKTKLRSIKQLYFSKETQLKILSSSFDEVFKYIDSLFQKFDNFIESAQYDEANTVLPEISKILKELDYDLSILPNLCTLVCNIIPEKIHEVNLAYDKMMEQHYPIHNLFIKQSLEKMNNDLGTFSKMLTHFETKGISGQLEIMQKDLDKMLNQFEKEKEAKNVYDSKIKDIYRAVNETENKYIRLKNIIPAVEEVYIIDENHINKINELQSDINVTSSLKRTIDTYIHSSTKQPYSLVVEKIGELESTNNVINTKLDEYHAFINSLKVDAETAYAAIFSIYKLVRKAEELIRKINLEAIKEKYDLKIENIYILLNQINDLLFARPIDIAKVNELVHQLSDCENIVADDGEIAQDYNMMMLTEGAIKYGNKYRNQIPEIDSLLSQAEVFFESADFEKANNTANLALSRIKSSNVR